MEFDYSSSYRAGLPAPKKRWDGFPPYNFVGGDNDADAVPVEDFIAASQSILAREGRTLATYGLSSGPQGYRPLREFIASSLKARAGIRQAADDILIVSGSLQALDLVNAVFLSPGDTVVLEEANYHGTLARLERAGVRRLGVPLDGNGMRMDALANILARLKAEGTRPKYIYTIPTVQNPTGSIMPEARRLEMLSLAREYDVPIFEDDCYADLTFDGTRPRAIRALDDRGQVVYCGSFSKTVAPALRVGYVVAEWEVLSRLLAVKYDAGSGALEQMMLAEYCATHFDAHVSELQGVLKFKCDTIMEALAAEFGTAAEFSAPKGGIFIWITLPNEVDTSRLGEVALAQGVALNPGAEWCADPETGRHRLRLCFGHPSEREIRDGIARLAQICYEETGIPARSHNMGRTL